ncbi:hypothetical protein Pcinc_023738 [Petrolisthes cinctipes]|uniref:RNA-directed DNA polymerase from transposon X-element n=1 Tax=Petrolisthes cinctipes TaxID=88211 RepID=A0AAE1FBR2_PETCI|nr:hypothetical protein Pcinc_023738 [Petrolisthes cinctipes]
MADIIQQSNLCLLNDGQATRVDDRSGNFSAIDLSLASPDIHQDFSWHPESDSLGSDHFPICLSYSSHTVSAPLVPKFNFKRADWGSFGRIVDLDMSGETIDEKMRNLTQNILHTAEVAIPKTSIIRNKREAHWWSTDCREALRKRNRRYRIFDKQPTQNNFIAYKRARAEARRVINRAKRDSWRSFVSTVNRFTPLTKVWSTIKILNNKRPYTPITTLQVDNNIYDDPVDVANVLARSFSKVSSSANYDQRFLHHKRMAELQEIDFATEDVDYPYNREFTIDELLLALRSCKDTSPGPDTITYGMIRHLGQDNLVKLLAVFNEIWVSNIFPNSWHFAWVIPIPKQSGRLVNPSSFRPIALTSCLCKVMERIINNRLLFVLEAKGLLSDRQCGFRKHRSTVDHLMNLEHCISKAFANKEFMVGVFLDIHKAYDMTWRHGILMKLHGYGLRGTTWGANRKSLLMVYKTLIRTKLDYGSQVYGSASDTTLGRLDVYQNKCLSVFGSSEVYTCS